MAEPPEDYKQYAAYRSHEDARARGEFEKAAAQAAILINGGAATAVLSYISKLFENSSGYLPYMAAALIGYAMGVLFAALMLYIRMIASQQFHNYWLKIYLDQDEAALRVMKLGGRMHKVSMLCFMASLLFFILSSAAISFGVIAQLKGA